MAMNPAAGAERPQTASRFEFAPTAGYCRVSCLKMSDAYMTIESIWNRYFSGSAIDVPKEILDLLLRENIRIREKDGTLKQINISRPTSMPNSFVVGLRYMKKDGRPTEDHFLCRTGCPIEMHYGKRLEKVLPEYKGTHIQRVDLSMPSTTGMPITYVNTISFQRGNL